MTALAAKPLLDPAVTDAELARRVAGGEEAAVRLLLRRHNQTLFRVARAILRDDTEAEDAVQDAYLKAIAAMGSFRSESRLSTWLTRITVNEALGRRRHARRGAEVITLAADGPAASQEIDDVPDTAQATPEESALRRESQRLMEARIDALPDAFRTVFVMRAVEDMSVEETAAALDIPESTVRTRFFRARALLRESISRDMDSALERAFHFAGERCDRIVERVLARLARQRGQP